ncbi:lysylphosphatidylglycerol synthase transmembrane domain-containing protein [Desulfobulbus alkaliphilus]|uniref:lysylphosphatidylglycerol synthase transmembrane domain-containing protein n=1 Tax=Desulfobulbus alkaliphilus TaxID=869814 RepID=UPI001962D238|nr:lysylphosphatidylglycerol synthase transmembrane domain-containing protein [Desulfobulbus alkaliphilus]MBM9538001.1 flippase-like domain-containing protein [Desulfobulbus alkaliphilus]
MSLKRYLFFAVKLTVSGTLLFFLYRQTPMADILQLFADCNLILLVLVFFILLINTVLSACKWKILLRADAIDIPLPKLVTSYLIGGFFNNFLPSNIGGDSYRVYDIMRKSREGVRSAASVFADRLTGFLALVSLSLISSLFAAVKLDRPLIIVLPLVILGLLSLVLFMLWKQTPIRRFLRVTTLDRFSALNRGAEKFFTAFAHYGADPRIILKVMFLSFLFQFSVIFAVYLMAVSLHAEVAFLFFPAFVPLIVLMEAIPLSVNGIGIRDAGYVFFFGLAGMTDIQTRSLAILFLAMTLLYSLIGGVLFLGRTVAGWKNVDKGHPAP